MALLISAGLQLDDDIYIYIVSESIHQIAYMDRMTSLYHNRRTNNWGSMASPPKIVGAFIAFRNYNANVNAGPVKVSLFYPCKSTGVNVYTWVTLCPKECT